VYHDKKWGIPVDDGRKHFAMLSLEGAQAACSLQGYSLSMDRKPISGYPDGVILQTNTCCPFFLHYPC
jgi:hypothetical protein